EDAQAPGELLGRDRPLRCARVRGRAETPGELAVREEPNERLGEGVRVARVDEHAVDAVLDQVGNAADPASHHPPPPTERLDHDAPHSLGPRGKDERGGLVERRGDLRLRQLRRPAGLLGQAGDEALHHAGQGSPADEATRSATGLRTARSREPYSRVGARQSPCRSAITAVSTRASRRAASAAAVSWAPWATTASGRNSRSSRAIRAGSPA